MQWTPENPRKLAGHEGDRALTERLGEGEGDGDLDIEIERERESEGGGGGGRERDRYADSRSSLENLPSGE